jgi:hypothetical protein
VEFLSAANLEILYLGNEPTFWSGQRLEVIDITLGSFGLLNSIIGLFDHRHILFTLRGSVLARLIRNPRVTNWGSFRGDLRDVLGRGPVENIGNEAGLGLATHWVQHALITIVLLDRSKKAGVL